MYVARLQLLDGYLQFYYLSSDFGRVGSCGYVILVLFLTVLVEKKVVLLHRRTANRKSSLLAFQCERSVFFFHISKIVPFPAIIFSDCANTVQNNIIPSI